MGMFDQAARYACRIQPQVVARRLLRGVRRHLELGQFHDTRTTPLPGQKDRTVDSVLALEDLDDPGKPVLVILEFQAEHDEDKLYTTLVSVAHMLADVRHGPERKGRFDVFAGFVYLQGRPSRMEIDMRLLDAAGKDVAGTQHRTLLWAVAEDDATEVLKEIERDFDQAWGLLFWVPLMQGAAGEDNLASWLRLVKRVESRRHQADLIRIALVFAELANTYGEWQDALKEFDMRESQVVLAWTADARAEARVQTRREDLLRLAQKRFKGELTEEDRQMISSQDSPTMLGIWLDAVVEAADYAVFRAILRQ